MSGKTAGTFRLNDAEYPIKPSVYRSVQMYLHKRDNIKWVSYEAPYITFTVETDKGNDKQVRRQIEQILTNSEIGENVVSDLRLKPIE